MEAWPQQLRWCNWCWKHAATAKAFLWSEIHQAEAVKFSATGSELLRKSLPTDKETKSDKGNKYGDSRSFDCPWKRKHIMNRTLTVWVLQANMNIYAFSSSGTSLAWDRGKAKAGCFVTLCCISVAYQIISELIEINQMTVCVCIWVQVRTPSPVQLQGLWPCRVMVWTIKVPFLGVPVVFRYCFARIPWIPLVFSQPG